MGEDYITEELRQVGVDVKVTDYKDEDEDEELYKLYNNEHNTTVKDIKNRLKTHSRIQVEGMLPEKSTLLVSLSE